MRNWTDQSNRKRNFNEQCEWAAAGLPLQPAPRWCLESQSKVKSAQTHSQKHAFFQTWQQAKINNPPSECRRNRKKLETLAQAHWHSLAWLIGQWLAEILIVRLHHVVRKQSQIRQHRPPWSTPIQSRAAFLIRVSFIYFSWLWFHTQVTPPWGANRWHCMGR